MKKIFLTLLLAIQLPVFAGTTAENASDLIGIWRIYNEANTEIASINITLAITKGGESRFTYKPLGTESTEFDQLQGLMVNQNQIVIESIKPGEANTYVFTIDFEALGGAGKLLKTVFADCSTIGVDASVVKSKYKDRLASSSQLCIERTTELSTLTNLKIAKDGVSPTTIPSTIPTPSEFTAGLSDVSTQIESAWKIKSSNSSSNRFLVKNTEANFLGYQFIYRIINKKQKLNDLTESGFKSSERIGLLLNDYLVMNNSFFKGKNGLNIIDLNKNKRNGTGDYILTPNADCFPSKSGASNTRVCTPNYDTSLASSISTTNPKASAQRINTKTKISFLLKP